MVTWQQKLKVVIRELKPSTTLWRRYVLLY